MWNVQRSGAPLEQDVILCTDVSFVAGTVRVSGEGGHTDLKPAMPACAAGGLDNLQAQGMNLGCQDNGRTHWQRYYFVAPHKPSSTPTAHPSTCRRCDRRVLSYTRLRLFLETVEDTPPPSVWTLTRSTSTYGSNDNLSRLCDTGGQIYLPYRSKLSLFGQRVYVTSRDDESTTETPAESMPTAPGHYRGFSIMVESVSSTDWLNENQLTPARHYSGSACRRAYSTQPSHVQCSTSCSCCVPASVSAKCGGPPCGF
jgi:hypothetical protein